MQDLKRQLEALEALKSYLIKFAQGLSELSGSYNSTVKSLVDSGLTVQISENYGNTYQQRNTNEIKKLIEMIETEDLPYVNNNIQALIELIERASAK